MTKIEEPVLSPRKKRSWSTTLNGRTPLFRHRPDGGGNGDDPRRHPHPFDRDASAADAKGATTDGGAPSSSAFRLTALAGRKMDMQTILERYHSLALTHYAQTKRRRVESAARSAQNAQRREQLTTLHKMAQDTLTFCTKVLRSEERARRENERERREAEEEVRRAEREKALAEEFLSRFGGGGSGANNRRHPALKYHAEGGHLDNIENEGQRQSHGVCKIGGIPSKFLDLSHFPKLQKSFQNEGGGGTAKKRDISFTPEEGDGKRKMSPPIIDCTDESASPQRHNSNHPNNFPMRIPSFGGVPQEVALDTQGKQNTKRIYISCASLSHVNGTYVQEGCHNDAPLFVRVGPPRKFMGKWDCSVVLRREAGRQPPERNSMKGGEGLAASGAVWKIGLVPAHRITHPRIIGYYAAREEPSSILPKRSSSNVDRMEEDDVDEGSGAYFEPPVEGWRVFQEAHVGVGNAALGRASGLTVSYEE